MLHDSAGEGKSGGRLLRFGKVAASALLGVLEKALRKFFDTY
jgi:hypothetical protein